VFTFLAIATYCRNMIGLRLDSLYLSGSKYSPTPPIPVLDVAKYSILQPPEKGILTDADHPANFACPVISLTIDYHRHILVS
jgi:hypothetical protein